jgi:hypothetical protein
LSIDAGEDVDHRLNTEKVTVVAVSRRLGRRRKILPSFSLDRKFFTSPDRACQRKVEFVGEESYDGWESVYRFLESSLALRVVLLS